MRTYEFSLKFLLPEGSAEPEAYIERLADAGCDDATIGIGQNGRIALNFDREARTAFDAVSSAISDIKSVIPNARLIEATPDLVGLTDIADIIHCSRQNMRKLMLASGASFPPPIHEGKISLWRLSKVLRWLRDKKQYVFDDALLDIAQINMQLNLAREARETDGDDNRHFHRLVS